MLLIGGAILFAIFLWWFSTGAILMLVRMARPVYPYAMVTGFALAVMALVGLYATRHSATAVGAFAGFTYGLLIWAALEMAFLFGYVTGPRKNALSARPHPAPAFPRRFRGDCLA